MVKGRGKYSPSGATAAVVAEEEEGEAAAEAADAEVGEGGCGCPHEAAQAAGLGAARRPLYCVCED